VVHVIEDANATTPAAAEAARDAMLAFLSGTK
jgi:hypothetical protein